MVFKIGPKLATIFAAAALVIAPNASSAPAMEQMVQAQPISQNENKIGINDASGHPTEVVESFAARTSKNSIVVLYVGNNIAAREEVRLGAAEAILGGSCKVRGMVYSSGPDDYMVIYIDSQPTTRKIFVEAKNARAKAKWAVEGSYHEVPEFCP